MAKKGQIIFWAYVAIIFAIYYFIIRKYIAAFWDYKGGVNVTIVYFVIAIVIYFAVVQYFVKGLNIFDI